MVIKKKQSNGFTLVEVIVVICILGMLIMMTVPICVGYIEEAKERVCEANCSQIKKSYEQERELASKEHTDELFNEMLVKHGSRVCPSEGSITYVDKEVVCERHGVDEDDSEAPIL